MQNVQNPKQNMKSNLYVALKYGKCWRQILNATKNCIPHTTGDF